MLQPLSLLFRVSAVQQWCTNFVMPLKAVNWPTGHRPNGLRHDNDEFLYNYMTGFDMEQSSIA